MTTTAPAPVASPPGRPTVVVAFRVAAGGHGRKRLRTGTPPPIVERLAGRVPRVARMLALAHRWKGLIDSGTVADQAALSRLVGVSRARVTQVMDLLRLAPDIQEAILYLPLERSGRGSVRECDLRLITRETAWTAQRETWVRHAANT